MIHTKGKSKSLARLQSAAAPVAAILFGAAVARASGPYNTVSFSSVSTNAYGAGDVNSCSVDINNLITIDGYQFIAFYNNSGKVVLGRRQASSSADNTNSWTLDTTSFTADSDSGGISDDHHTISLAVDGNGQMHLSWGMHNDAFNYAISSASVIGGAFSPSFTQESQTTMEDWFPELNTVDQVTYPQFYNIPNSGNLLLVYRDAASASGGGSGNGNEYFAVYDATTKTYSSPTNVEMLDGGITNVNGYMNNLVYTPSGTLMATWTWRATPNWQTNSNLLYAQSPDNGASWYQFGGSTQYGLPIIQNTSGGGTASQVAQSVYNIPEGSSYINQSSMTVDNDGNPIVATYSAPGWTATSSTSGYGNPNRQYMLYYYNGSSWQQSVVSDRTSDTSVDYSGNDVRDLGRPIALVDQSDRVLVVTRSEDTSMGSYSNSSTPNNDIVVYYSTVSALDSGDANWRSVTLDGANMGEYEPTYDPGLWAQSNVLNLIYEPVGLSGEHQQTIQVLQWDENAFFAAGITWNNISGTGDGATWDSENNQNWDNGTNSVNFMAADNVTFNDSNNGHYNVTLNSTVSPGNVTVDNTFGNYVISGSGGIAGNGTLTKSGSATLTLSTVNSYTGATAVSDGDLIVGVPGALPENTGLSISGSGRVQLASDVGTLTLSGLTISAATGAALDIGNNTVILNYGATDPKATILQYVVSGYDAGTWDGPGINSSAAGTGHAVGFADGADGIVAGLVSGQIELKYTIYGDANLDGVVNSLDFGTLAANFGKSVANGWEQGDFNYDGVVNSVDFGMLAANFGKSDGAASVVLSSAQWASLDAFAAGNGLLADVPEPNSLVALNFALLGLLARRRRRNHNTGSASARTIS
jgi:autotransporter-associated beta strand protein